MTTARNLERESQAVEFLRQHLRDAIGTDDEDIFRDIIEGQTNFFETLNAAAEQLIADDGLIAGTNSIIATLKKRADRIAHRIEVLREAVRLAMERADLKSHQAPAGTFTRMVMPPKTVIIDEAIIPESFWKHPPPVLSKSALLTALKNGEDIPGASLSNRGETLQFRSG